jgi:large subunit ribosomal protein L10
MRIEKKQMVEDIGAILKDADFLFLITYKGLSVAAFSELRDKLADKNAQCRVLKNRLIRKAAEKEGLTALSDLELKGDTALVSGSGDPGEIAKIIDSFGKSFDAVAAKGGCLDGALLTPQDVKDIAQLPPKEVLLAQLLGVLEAPARNLVGVLNAKATEILNILNAYKEKKENA